MHGVRLIFQDLPDRSAHCTADEHHPIADEIVFATPDSNPVFTDSQRIRATIVLIEPRQPPSSHRVGTSLQVLSTFARTPMVPTVEQHSYFRTVQKPIVAVMCNAFHTPMLV